MNCDEEYKAFCRQARSERYRNRCNRLETPTTAMPLPITPVSSRDNWLKAIRREDLTPTSNSRVCSCNFPNKDKKCPTLFDSSLSTTSVHLNDKLIPSRKRGIKVIESQIVETLNQVNNLEGTISNLKRELEEERKNHKHEMDCRDKEISILKLRTRFILIRDNDKMISLYTGLPTSNTFLATLSFLSEYELTYYFVWKVVSLPLEDQLLITLMKLMLNCQFKDLCFRFRVPSQTVSNIFHTILSALHKLLFKTCMRNVPSLEKKQGCLPDIFTSFTNCRGIWDCTELKIEVPRQNMEHQKLTYSSYKSSISFKALISVVPNGVIKWCNNLYVGCSSDKEIVRNSGILVHLEAGDLVLADKGFLVRKLLPLGVSLNILPFLVSVDKQFTREEAERTRKVARARIHVERAIKRLKHFRILTLLPASFRGQSSVIFQTCCALINLQHPIIQENDNCQSY